MKKPLLISVFSFLLSALAFCAGPNPLTNVQVSGTLTLQTGTMPALQITSGSNSAGQTMVNITALSGGGSLAMIITSSGTQTIVTSGRIVVTSQWGLQDDSRPFLLFGATEATSGTVGADQTATAQALLDSDPSHLLWVINDVAFSAENLKFHGNTHWQNLEDCGIVQEPHSTAPLITNLDHIATSGSAIDPDITIEGGYLNFNAGVTTGTSYQPPYWSTGSSSGGIGAHYVPAGIWMIGAPRFTLKNIHIFEPVSSAVHLINCDDYQFSGVVFNTGLSPYFGNNWRDVHINGPSDGGDTGFCRFTTNDDFFAYNTEDVIGGTVGGTVYPSNFGADGGSGGHIIHQRFHDNIIANSGSGYHGNLRISSGSYLADDIIISHNSGLTQGTDIYNIGGINQQPGSSGYLWSGSGPGNIGSVLLDGNNIGFSTQGASVYHISGNHVHIAIMNEAYPATCPGYPTALLFLDGGVQHGDILLKDDNWDLFNQPRSGVAGPAGMILDGTANISVIGCSYLNGNQQARFIEISSTMGPSTMEGNNGVFSGAISIKSSDFTCEGIIDDDPTYTLLGGTDAATTVSALTIQDVTYASLWAYYRPAFYAGIHGYNNVTCTGLTLSNTNAPAFQTAGSGSFNFVSPLNGNAPLQFAGPAGVSAIAPPASGTASLQSGTAASLSGTLPFTANQTFNGTDNTAPNQFSITGTVPPTDGSMLMTLLMMRLGLPGEKQTTVALGADGGNFNAWASGGQGAANVSGDKGFYIASGTYANGGESASNGLPFLSTGSTGSVGGQMAIIDWRQPNHIQFCFAFETGLATSSGSATLVIGASGGTSGLNREGLALMEVYATGTTATMILQGDHSTTVTSGTFGTIRADSSGFWHCADIYTSGTVGSGSMTLFMDGTFSGQMGGGPQNFDASGDYMYSSINNGTNSGTAAGGSGEIMVGSPVKFRQ